MAAAVMNLPSVEVFHIDDSGSLNLAKRWQRYKEDFELYLIASGVTQDKQKLALLLHLGGKELREIYHSIKEENENYASAIGKLDAYFIPKKKHHVREVYVQANVTRRRRKCSKYVARLRRLADTCDYATRIDEEIRDQFIFHCFSDSLRQKLLRTENLTLQKLLEIAVIKEQTFKLAAEISKTKSQKPEQIQDEDKFDSDVTAIRNYPRRGKNDFVNRGQIRRDQASKPKECFRCGGTFDKGHLENCKAKGKSCFNCGRQNHFSKVCKQTVRHVELTLILKMRLVIISRVICSKATHHL